MPNDLGIDQFIRILFDARDRLSKSQTSDGQTANPPGWQDKAGYLGDPGGTATISGPTKPGSPGTGWAGSPVDPGMKLGPDDAPGWHDKPYANGKFASVLTDEQAQAFNLMMDIMGHNGDTVGRGSVVPLHETQGKVRAE